MSARLPTPEEHAREAMRRTILVGLGAVTAAVERRDAAILARLDALRAMLSLSAAPREAVDALDALRAELRGQPTEAAPPRRGALTPYRQSLADAGHCLADGDGDCAWEGCPQNRPETRQSHCPRDVETRRGLDPEDEGRAGNG